MREASVIIRSIKLSDLSSVLKLSTSEGWNQTENDWRFLIENPQNVCLLAEWNNEVIGTTTALNYSNNVVWIGMVLVDKEYRGVGISKLLLTAIFKKIEFSKSVKLDATPLGQSVYKKFGFKDEYFIARMVNPSIKVFPIDECDIAPELIQLKDVPGIIDFDKAIFGANRQQLIDFFIKQYPRKGWFLKHNNKIIGFVFGRVGNKYYQIGPVAATTDTVAKILITKALEGLTDQAVVVDVLYDKEETIKWLTSIGFIKQRHFIRMYKEKNPFPGVTAKQYLICGPEFG